MWSRPGDTTVKTALQARETLFQSKQGAYRGSARPGKAQVSTGRLRHTEVKRGLPKAKQCQSHARLQNKC